MISTFKDTRPQRFSPRKILPKTKDGLFNYMKRMRRTLSRTWLKSSGVPKRSLHSKKRMTQMCMRIGLKELNKENRSFFLYQINLESHYFLRSQRNLGINQDPQNTPGKPRIESKIC